MSRINLYLYLKIKMNPTHKCNFSQTFLAPSPQTLKYGLKPKPPVENHSHFLWRSFPSALKLFSPVLRWSQTQTELNFLRPVWIKVRAEADLMFLWNLLWNAVSDAVWSCCHCDDADCFSVVNSLLWFFWFTFEWFLWNKTWHLPFWILGNCQ